MSQTAMFIADPTVRSVSVAGGVQYTVRDQIAVVDNDHIAHMISLGFVPANTVSRPAAEVSSEPLTTEPKATDTTPVETSTKPESPAAKAESKPQQSAPKK